MHLPRYEVAANRYEWFSQLPLFLQMILMALNADFRAGLRRLFGCQAPGVGPVTSADHSTLRTAGSGGRY